MIAHCEFCYGSVDHRALGAKLRAEREKRGLSQKEVAGGMGITPSYLSELEHGKRPWSARLRDLFLKTVKEIL